MLPQNVSHEGGRPKNGEVCEVSGVLFEFREVSRLNRLGELKKDELGIHEDEATAMNCIQGLGGVLVDKRVSVIHMMQSLRSRVVTVVEEEADFLSSLKVDFLKCF